MHNRFCYKLRHPDSVMPDTFLQINDQINTVLTRYEAFKRGDYAAAANPVPAELSRPQNDLSLIDFDDSAPSTTSTTAAPSQIDELASLFGPSSTSTAQPPLPQIQAQPQVPPLLGQSSSFISPHPTGTTIHPQVNYASRPGGHVVSPQFTTPTATPPHGAIRLNTPQATQQPQSSQPSTPNYFAAGNVPAVFGGNGTFGLGSSSSAQPTLQTQAATPQSQPSQAGSNSNTQTQGKDPFADLVGLF